MRTLTIIFILLIQGLTTAVIAQTHMVHGRLTDKDDNTPLSLATVYVQSLSRGTQPNDTGYYAIQLPAGTHYIIFSLLGYETDTVEVDVRSSMRLDVQLTSLSTNIDEIVITGRHSDENIKQTETGLIALNRKEIEKLPYLLGEMDPIRILQLMPGVQTAGEGNTGFYVRGGAVDQNLMLLDNSIVYNPSHLLGFFSVFNGSVINDLEMFKGGIPAYYGGRLSSITRVNTRKGNEEKISGEGGLGLIAVNALVEGPIKKNKGSFLIGARRTYVDLFIDPLRELVKFEEKVNYYFYDVNANADYQLTDRDNLKFRLYNGNDSFEYGKGSFSNRIRWGNTAASLNWRHRHTDRLFSQFSVGLVLYKMEFNAAINQYRFNIFSDINDKNINYQLDYSSGKHHLTFGASYTHHAVRPNNVNAASDDVALDFNNNTTLFSDEQAVYVHDKFELSDRIEFGAGVRLTGFSQLGKFTRYIQDENFQVLDTITYGRGKRIKQYFNVEPRAAMRISLDEESSIKLSFDRGYQYMHMAPLSSASLPMDVWVSSSEIVKPQSANQYAIGYFRNFELKNVTYEASAVTYYKRMKNQLEYRDGVIIGYSKGLNYDDNFVFGEGESYGIELLTKKNAGQLTGQVAYTLSKTIRIFPDLNKGKAFSAKYDRRHDLSMMANYEINPKWTLSSVFVYGTGNALNLPVARYIIQGNVISEYGARNSFRMPAYHRLDFAATYIAGKSKRYESAWIFSVYNVYNRRNPYYIYFETSGNLKDLKIETTLKQVSLFPVLPSVTYRFKF